MVSLAQVWRQATARRSVIHIRGEPGPHGLREVLPTATSRLQSFAWPFKILAYNTALIPASYKGPSNGHSFSADALRGLIQGIIDEQPDVVGLCEVFDNDVRAFIRRELAHGWSWSLAGPDEADFDEDGGLLLLSRHPILSSSTHIYRTAAFPDSFSNKGVLHAQIAPPGGPSVDVFLSHTQALYPSGAEQRGETELREQLGQELGPFVAQRRGGGPAFVIGDLNFPADQAPLYDDVLRGLGDPVDLWLARPVTAAPDAGHTFVHDNDFYADPDDDDRPPAGSDARLDYILLYPGSSDLPVLHQMETVRFKGDWNGQARDISDHIGVIATFHSCLRLR